jgi:D-alanine-D-alanine ligase
MNIEPILKKFKNKKIAVLYGGISSEREISLVSGKAVLESLKKMKLNAFAIDADRTIMDKIKKTKPDAAFIVLHGPFGEDGLIQGALETMGVPYTGCGVFSSAASMDKNISKILFKSAGLNTPNWFVLDKSETLPKIKKYPVVVKPIAGGSTIGISLVNKPSDLAIAVKKAFKYDDRLMVEEFVKGKEITVAVLNGKALPIIEIIPKGGFYDYKAKYQKNGSQHIIPARIDKSVYLKAQNYAELIYKVFNCRAVCRADMIIDKNNKLWVLENNTIPGMTASSLVPDAAKYCGIGFDELVLQILNSAEIYGKKKI